MAPHLGQHVHRRAFCGRRGALGRLGQALALGGPGAFILGLGLRAGRCLHTHGCLCFGTCAHMHVCLDACLSMPARLCVQLVCALQRLCVCVCLSACASICAADAACACGRPPPLVRLPSHLQSPSPASHAHTCTRTHGTRTALSAGRSGSCALRLGAGRRGLSAVGLAAGLRAPRFSATSPLPVGLHERACRQAGESAHHTCATFGDAPLEAAKACSTRGGQGGWHVRGQHAGTKGHRHVFQGRQTDSLKCGQHAL